VSFDSIAYKEPPEKFEAGTAPLAEAHGLGLALDFLSELGMERVERESLDIAMRAREMLSRIKGARFVSHPESRGIVSFHIDGVSPFDVGALLGEAGVCVRVGRHCAEPLHSALGLEGSIRASFGVYNDARDAEALVSALEKAIRTLG
ncbi:MAG: aminotransferase class V-fold PLP-dependent enzyme, partial [Rickettsiales bacterium]|nr:aminotransferase class V-fold PLP-dependent enzyme [Rickettsiales bacterium]